MESVAFELNGVFLRSSLGNKHENFVNGVLKIVHRKLNIFFEWNAQYFSESNLSAASSSEADVDWDIVSHASAFYSSPTTKTRRSSSPLRMLPTGLRSIHFDLAELKSYKFIETEDSATFVFILADGTTYPSFHFFTDAYKKFRDVLDRYVVIKPSLYEENLFVVRDNRTVALEKSFNELKLFNEQSNHFVTNFFKDPYSTTFTGFSKVAQFFIDSVLYPSANDPPPLEDLKPYFALKLRDEDSQDDKDFFQFVSCSNLPQRHVMKRCGPLSQSDWISHINPEGKIINKKELLKRIFRGGISCDTRREVWKFLLNYFPFESTYEERLSLRKRRMEDYYRIKLQWKSIDSEQEKNNNKFREIKHLIEKDVTRTDRTHFFYESSDNANLRTLNDILMTYGQYNFDLGYVQGMNDLLAPILVNMENEVDAFWCFVGFMQRMKHNFEMDQHGIKLQLTHLSTLCAFLDFKLFSYLSQQDSANFYFTFRWLLILFKREFSYPDIMCLWEVLWTDLPCANFHLLICLAILDTQKHTIIENQFGLTEILKHINDMAMSIDLNSTISKAESMFFQIKEAPNVPCKVLEILGLPISSLQSLNQTKKDHNDCTDSASVRILS